MGGTYDGEIVGQSRWGIASYAVESCSICSRDAEDDDCDDEGNKADIPELLEGPGRGLITGVDLHVCTASDVRDRRHK